jgi:hypothetical protein
MWPLRALGALVLLACTPLAQASEEHRVLDFDEGVRIQYTLRRYPEGAHLVPSGAQLEPRSALDTARLIGLHLATGDLEEAAVLSNAPRRRFEVLQEYRRDVGEEEFRRVFAQYADPRNRLVAEIGIGAHRLLVWELRGAEGEPAHLAGQYYVDTEGRVLLDDVPNPVRADLRRILLAYRNGKLRFDEPVNPATGKD